MCVCHCGGGGDYATRQSQLERAEPTRDEEEEGGKKDERKVPPLIIKCVRNQRLS